MIKYLPERNLNLHGDHVYTRKLNLDLDQLKTNAMFMKEYIIKNFCGVPSKEASLSGQDTMMSKLFNKYNYFLYPLSGNHGLFLEIQKIFHDVCPSKDAHFMQCWINVFNRGEFIDWHSHWLPEWNSWHGFYCLDVEPNSHTTYKIQGREIVVNSENNLLVISKSGLDQHRSSVWNEDYPRITIAFDIVPENKLNTCFLSGRGAQNHWIPI